MKSLLHVLIFFSSLHLTFLCQNRISSVSAYTITPSQYIKDGQNLTSQSEAFELGFFCPSDSKNRYLGIWYKRIPLQTVVWVANGDSPLNDTSGVFTISSMGNLVILNGTNHTIWSTNLSTTAKNPILEFLELGNLVLRDGNNSDRYLWQSFDHPSDTMLPGMKLGWNLQTGLNRYMTSWKSFNDPSHGDFTYEIDLNGVPEAVIRYGSSKYYRSGPFNGIRNSGSPNLKDETVFKYVVVVNATEVSYSYRLVKQSVIARLVLKQNDNEGKLERYVWIDQSQRWVANEPIPRDSCDPYGLCGANSTCNTNDVPICQCLKGFKPKSPREWNENNRSQGCERQMPLECESGEGFVKFKEVKLPETTRSWTNISMTTEDCRGKCLKNCSCMAYANSDISGGGSDCIMWFGDLIDMRKLLGAGQDLYIRMAASELEADAPKETKRELKKKKQKLIITFSVIAAIFLLGLVIYFIWTKKKKSIIKISTEVTNRDPQFCEEFMHGKRNYTGEKNGDLELNLFDMDMILRVTQNFSQTNMLGQGGFGYVYKGTLENGQKIAVKRLSKSSEQGVEEFKNEVMLIARLQHRNLVRLLGFCIESEEKLLVYEYMENKGLDAILFNKAYKNILDWQTRFNIIMGISRGLLYLHQDSRFRIIHRDLKTSNVLLDGHLNPKISDFGMARIFGGDDTEGKTKRVVGTYGYMSPEYAMAGIFSVKSDVFSFGVVLLEIISGMKNKGYFTSDNQVNLLGYAWKLWREERSIELIDETVKVSCVPDEALRCIHIGLLCVQEHADDRPTISTVVSMLSTHDTTTFQQPKPPGFCFGRSPIEAGSSSNKQDSESCSVNNVTVTVLEAR